MKTARPDGPPSTFGGFKVRRGLARTMRLVVLALVCAILAGCAEAPLPTTPAGALPTALPTRAPTPPPVATPTPGDQPPFREPVEDPVGSFVESFEDGLDGWTVDVGDATTDCDARAAAGCALRVTQPCCGFPYTDVHRDVGVAMPATLSVRFFGSTLTSDEDHHLELFFASGAQYVFDVTIGYTQDNTGIQLRGPRGMETGVFARWTSPGEWYEATIRIDAPARTMHVLVRDADGKPIGASSLPMTEAEPSLTWVRFRSVDHTGGSAFYLWDELRIEPTIRETLLVEGFEEGFGAWTVENASAAVDCAPEGATGCRLRLQPECCRRYVDVARETDIALPADVSVRFRGSATRGNLDQHFELFTARGTQYVFDITHGDNDGIRLLGPEGRTTGVIARWNATDAWHEARFGLDPAEGVVTVRVSGPDGEPLGSSQLPLSRGEDRLAWLRFRAMEYDPAPSLTFHWDDVRVTASR